MKIETELHAMAQQAKRIDEMGDVVNEFSEDEDIEYANEVVREMAYEAMVLHGSIMGLLETMAEEKEKQNEQQK